MYRAGSLSDRRHAIIKCAKSWHTPRREASTSSTGVPMVVARLIVAEFGENTAREIFGGAQQRTARREGSGGVLRKRRAEP